MLYVILYAFYLGGFILKKLNLKISYDVVYFQILFYLKDSIKEILVRYSKSETNLNSLRLANQDAECTNEYFVQQNVKMT